VRLVLFSAVLQNVYVGSVTSLAWFSGFLLQASIHSKKILNALFTVYPFVTYLTG
jgi:hypothetical protein